MTLNLNGPGAALWNYMALYEQPTLSTRSGPLFNAFPYPTKISPEAVALFIASHTNPGDRVFDGFAGSGTTGIAAILCGKPTETMKHEAERLGLSVKWGDRKATIYEIGVLGSLVSRVLCSPPDPNEFYEAAQLLLETIRIKYLSYYQAQDPFGGIGRIRYIVWSEVLRCPSCKSHTTFWDACVSRRPAKISAIFECPTCNEKTDASRVSRVRETVRDDILNNMRKTRRRVPIWIYGETNGHTWSRAINATDLRVIANIENQPPEKTIPKKKFPWGDLFRAGYHDGITHLHHFYTRRNLSVFAALWNEVNNYPEHLRDALKLWLLSYNASHSTIMTRVVAKKKQNDLVVTSAQPGVLYVSSLPVEKNIFSGIERKLQTITNAFRLTYGNHDLVDVRNKSSLSVDLPDCSVDYIFMDPPFGGNIPYSEINSINEAWLGLMTSQKEEAIISRHQGKTVNNYQQMLTQAFREAHRILRPDACATVCFHSTTAQVWNALSNACKEAGFSVSNTSILNKTQSSFKQVNSPGAVKGDPLILLNKYRSLETHKGKEITTVISDLITQARNKIDPVENSPQRLYSRFISHYLTTDQQIPINASDFFQQLKQRQEAFEK